MAKFNPKKGLKSWWTYWRESLNAGQEKHDFMLYTLVTLLILVSGILIFSGIPLPDLDFSDPVPHKVLVVFEISIAMWILLYLPYKRHNAEEENHREELNKKKAEADELRAEINQQTDKQSKMDSLALFLVEIRGQVDWIQSLSTSGNFDGSMAQLQTDEMVSNSMSRLGYPQYTRIFAASHLQPEDIESPEWHRRRLEAVTAEIIKIMSESA